VCLLVQHTQAAAQAPLASEASSISASGVTSLTVRPIHPSTNTGTKGAVYAITACCRGKLRPRKIRVNSIIRASSKRGFSSPACFIDRTLKDIGSVAPPLGANWEALRLSLRRDLPASDDSGWSTARSSRRRVGAPLSQQPIILISILSLSLFLSRIGFSEKTVSHFSADA